MTQAPASEQHAHNIHQPILRANGLGFQYANSAPLFAKLDFSVPAGVAMVLGDDGRGKTTLMRLLAGERRSTTGQLFVNGISLDDQAAAYRQRIFWIDPKTEVFDQLAVADFFALQRASWETFNDTQLATCIGDFDLTEHLHKQLFMLSTGSKRKVWLAAAFASGAPVTLLDMPFAAVDKASGSVIVRLLQHAAGQLDRVCIVADYEAPEDVPLSTVIDLGSEGWQPSLLLNE